MAAPAFKCQSLHLTGVTMRDATRECLNETWVQISAEYHTFGPNKKHHRPKRINNLANRVGEDKALQLISVSAPKNRPGPLVNHSHIELLNSCHLCSFCRQPGTTTRNRTGRLMGWIPNGETCCFRASPPNSSSLIRGTSLSASSHVALLPPSSCIMFRIPTAS
jgi:hypothetical protein